MTTATAHHRAHHASRLEYALYFALILLISVPTALVRTLLPSRRRGARRFFLAEAWSMAGRVTPQIFTV